MTDQQATSPYLNQPVRTEQEARQQAAISNRPVYQRGDLVQMSDGRAGTILAVWHWTCATAPDASHWRVKLMIEGHVWQYAADQITGRAKIKPRLHVIHGSPVAPRLTSDAPPPSAA